MKKVFVIPFVATAFALSLGLASSCSVSVSSNTTSDSTATAAPAPEAAAPSGPAAGTTCYVFADETIDISTELTYDGTSAVSGTLVGTIHDKAEGYFTSYATDFEGTREGDNLKLKTKTEIEGDVQEEEATWTWDGTLLNDGKYMMSQAPCEAGGE